MQTWAKRGVQAALVTGGMLAVGTGVASASQTCPDRPTPPLGESVFPPVLDELGDDTVPADRCFAGEQHPDAAGTQYNAPLVETRASHPVTALTGTLDPVHDLLPAVENDMTRELPALRDAHWHGENGSSAPENGDGGNGEDETAPLHLAGWIADPAAARPLNTVTGLPPFGERPVTPAEGFHRSLSWAGPIGEVIQGGANTLDGGAFRAGTVLDVPADLVIPHDELVYFDGFDSASGIVELWENALSRGQLQPQPQEPTGLVALEQVDLTSAEVPSLQGLLHTVPHHVVAGVLSAVAAAPTPRADFVPLEVPGEHQAQANEIPDLTGLLDVSKTPGTVERSESPGLEAPLPGLGKLNAIGGGQTSVPAVSRITAALEGTTPRHEQQPSFSDAPLRSGVAFQVVDELAAAVPPEAVVTQSPFGSTAPRSGGTGLPGLGGGIPDITAVQGETLPLPGITPHGVLRTLENADTVVMSRI